MKRARKGVLLFVLFAAALAVVGLTLPFLRQAKEAEAMTTTTGEVILSPASLQTGAVTLGYTVVGNSLGRADANSMTGSRFVVGSENGTVTSISVYVGNVDNSPNNKYQMAVYTDNNGAPGTLVTRTNTGALTANAWNTLPANAALSAKTPYWLLYNTNSSTRSVNNVRYDVSIGRSVRSSKGEPFGSWPRQFGNASVQAGVYSIYATYLPVVVNQTPSPTMPVATPTAQPTVGTTPTVPPTATPLPTSTPAPAPPTPTPSTKGPPVVVDAKFYASLKSQLKAGDRCAATVIRSGPDIPMTATDPKFQSMINSLNAINKSEIGVKKSLAFSAIDDLKNLKGYIPADVDIIGYDMEGSMTPAAEFQNIPASVKQFADIVHATGREMTWGPIRSTYDNLEQSGQLATILQSTDTVVYQAQKLLPTVTVSQFVQIIQGKYNYVKGVNPQAKLYVQLWLGSGPSYQTIDDAFNGSKTDLDIAGIGTHGDLTGIETVLSGLNWR